VLPGVVLTDGLVIPGFIADNFFDEKSEKKGSWLKSKCYSAEPSLVRLKKADLGKTSEGHGSRRVREL
jgi:hypothetical protein